MEPLRGEAYTYLYIFLFYSHINIKKLSTESEVAGRLYLYSFHNAHIISKLIDNDASYRVTALPWYLCEKLTKTFKHIKLTFNNHEVSSRT